MPHRSMTLRMLALALPIALAAPVLAAGPEVGHGPMGSPIIHKLMMALHSLDLTEDQKDQIHARMDQFHKANETKFAQLRTAHKALVDQVLTDPIDEPAIRSDAATMSVLHADALVAAAHLAKDIRGILTTDQRDQVEKALANVADGDMHGPHDGAWPRHGAMPRHDGD